MLKYGLRVLDTIRRFPYDERIANWLFYTLLEQDPKRIWCLREDILEKKRSRAVHKYGLQALDSIHRSLSKEQIVYWLYAGTLLGTIRDGNFLKDDTDIDIGVWYDKKQQDRLEEILTAKGFTKIREFKLSAQILLQRFEYQGVGIDFDFFIQSAGRAIQSSFVEDDYLVEIHYDVRDLNAMKVVPFKGIQVSVPQDPTKLLERLYGNWRVPVKKKDFLQNWSVHPSYVHYRSKQGVFRRYAPSIHEVKNYVVFFMLLKKLRWKKLPDGLIRYASRIFRR